MLSEAKIGPKGWPGRTTATAFWSETATAGAGRCAPPRMKPGVPPGVWKGRCLAAVGLAAWDVVTERQAELLLGEGRHPDADRIERELLAAGESPARARRATVLCRPIEHNQSPETEKGKERTPWLAMDLTFRAPSAAQIAWACSMRSSAWCWSCARTSPGIRRWRGWRARFRWEIRDDIQAFLTLACALICW
ncbi:relaxase domain-containing protein [Streptomyces sp. NPDC006475]|uniref:relaxase domain-containing protein n=1 Tax=Streptomyces sp. NPDC006475 TaxID=3155719 RepID=UPI0033AAC3A1